MRERSWFYHHEVQLGIITTLIVAIFAALTPTFLQLDNLIHLLETYSVMAIMAAGLFVVLVSGGIDISFAGIAAASQYLTVSLLVNSGGNWFTAFAIAILFGLALGLLNALLIHYLNAISVIVTIGTMTFYFAILLYLTRGISIYDLPDWFLSNPLENLSWLGPFASIRFPVVVTIVVLLLTWIITEHLVIGRQIYAIGGNFEAASRQGCHLLGLRCFAFGYSGVTAGIAGLIQAHRVQEVVPNALIGRELDVLAAVVLGGASLTGGVGSMSGVVLGIILLAILQNGLALTGLSSYSFGIVTGIVILVSVSFTAYTAKRQRQKNVYRII